jgi:2-C-methyl-D-erythritol 2,4-cyclodiphosphate synthase
MSAQVRTGIGWDSHRLEAGRALVIGGVEIDHDRGLQGHSDADVLAHAVIDAVLGAACLGDIGEHFPDTDPAFAGAASLALLREAVARAAATGWRPEHVDATVIMERPKLKDAKARIRARLAEALGLGEDAVNVKATTGEGIGFVGREEGVAALAVATLSRG